MIVHTLMGFSEFLGIKCFCMQMRSCGKCFSKCHAFHKLVPNLSQQKLPSHVVSTHLTAANPQIRLTTTQFDKVDSFPATTSCRIALWNFSFFSFSSKTTERANGTAIRELLKQEPNVTLLA